MNGTINDDPLGRVDARVDNVPAEIVFIEADGRWYFSLAYTIAYLAASANAVDEPDYGAWRQVLESGSAGADSPTGAVERLLDAAPTLDVEDGVLAIDPIEAKLLHDFMPVILDAIGESRDEALSDFDLEVTELELDEEIDGDTAQVFVERFSVRVVDPDLGPTAFDLDGDWCYRFDDAADPASGCLRDDLANVQDDLDRALESNGIDLDIDLRDVLPDRPFISTTRRDGRWYVSPLATLFAYSGNALELASDVAGQLQGELGLDNGFAFVEALPIDESTTVTVDSDGVVADVGHSERRPVRESVRDRADVLLGHHQERRGGRDPTQSRPAVSRRAHERSGPPGRATGPGGEL